MEERFSCTTVRDLLPNYIEQLTSEQTNEGIRKHLENCSECSAIYHKMQEEIPVQTVPETKEFKKYLNKTKAVYSMMGLLIIGIIAILASVIVDLAVNRAFSWSLIVIGGIVFTYAVGYFLINGGKNRFIKAYACVNVLVLPLLGLIQAVTYHYFMAEPTVWFWNFGLPVTVAWLVILWIGIFIFNISRNIFLTLSFLFLMAVPTNFYTNYYLDTWMNLQDYMENHFLGNGLANVVAVVVLLIIGIRVQIKRTKEAEDERNSG